MKSENVLPKNIRQIGEIQQDKRIYLEDYVMTYIRKKEKAGEADGSAGVLLGTRQESEDGLLFFVKGAVPMDEEWKQLQQKYFPELMAVGYYVIGRMQEEKLETVTDFAVERPFVVLHLQEEEEKLYWSEEQDCRRLKGFFIFYERNPQMQKYMAECCEPEKVEEEEGGSDQAILSFREKVKEKHAMSRAGSLRYLAGSFLTLVVLFLGVTIINNYDKMKSMEEAIAQISVEQERERLQLAADSRAVVTASSPQAAAETEGTKEEGQAQEESETKEESQAQEESEIKEESQTQEESAAREASSDDILAEIDWEEILPPQAEEGEETQPALPEDTAVSAGSDAVLSDISISQSAKALAERNYSAEQADVAENEINALPERQMHSAYTVKYGDTLAGISERYYGSMDRVEEICALNEIDDANMIVPGQKIVLP